MEIKKMHEQIDQGLDSALKALDDHDYERVNEFVSSQVQESDNESDRIPDCGPTFGSLVLGSNEILVSEFDGTYR
jgi:hypothetical protein